MLPFSRFTPYFLEVARIGSLRKAADNLHISASAIDRQILLAEEELDVQLFERLPQGMRLTLAGEMLASQLKRSQKEYLRTLENIDDLKGLKRGHVSIAMIGALSEGHIAKALAALSVEYPHISFDLRILDNQEIAIQIATAEVDFGLMLDPVEHASLAIKSVTDIPLGVAMPLNHPLALFSELRPSQLVDHRLLVAAAPLTIQKHTQSLFTQYQWDFEQAVVCNSVSMMRSLIREGTGISVLSLLDVADDVANHKMRFISLKDRKLPTLTLALCANPYRQLSRAAQMVMQQLSTQLTV